MQKSGFFTSVGGDRKYGADWLAQFTASIISNGVYTTELTVSGNNGMSVLVGPGRAWINGYMYLNDSAITLPISAADGALSRTDLVVLRLDMTDRQITLAVVQGDFGGSVPALTRTSDVYELCLARIAVATGTTQVTAQLITDTRADETVCGIVAGAVTQLSTGELLNQLKAGFDEWFANVKGQLSTDAAGNLQNQINDCVKQADKATEEEAAAGTDDTKWMTPAKIKLALGKMKLLQAYTQAGSYTFTTPDGITKLLVFEIGGGGSGACNSNLQASMDVSGGGSGFFKAFLLSVSAGQTKSVVVGAGASAISTTNNANGLTGGSTSFAGVSVFGGNGGYSGGISTGGQSPVSANELGTTPYGRTEKELVSHPRYDLSVLGNFDLSLLSLFLNYLPFYAAAGGSATSSSSMYAVGSIQSSVSLPNGHTTSSSVKNASGGITATKGTDPGCGGGAAICNGNGGYTSVSAAGCDGAVFVYGV